LQNPGIRLEDFGSCVIIFPIMSARKKLPLKLLAVILVQVSIVLFLFFGFSSVRVAVALDCSRLPDLCPPPPPPPAPTPTPTPQLALSLYMDSISPFTTIKQNAPVGITVPRGVVINFSVSSNLSVYDFVWKGAREISQTGTSSKATFTGRKTLFPDSQVLMTTSLKTTSTSLTAETSTSLSTSTSTSYTVTVTPYVVASDGSIQPRSDKAKTITVLMTSDDASSVGITITDPVTPPIIGYTGKQFICHAATSSPSGINYDHLIYWSGGGSPTEALGPQFSTSYMNKGKYTMKAGPASSLAFEIYKPSVTGYQPSQITYGVPITFHAATDPPEYIDRVAWHVDTMHDHYTHAEPDTGQGPSFTTTFTMTQFRPGSWNFWAQINADNVGALASTDIDAIPPNAATDVRAEPATSTAIRLSWTAQSDDDGPTGAGRITDILVACSLTPITEANFSINQIPPNPGGLPGVGFQILGGFANPGQKQESSILNVTRGQRNYYAVKLVDDAGNLSPISNVILAAPDVLVPQGGGRDTPQDPPLDGVPDDIYGHTGEFYIYVSDLVVPSRGFPFQMLRRYRSQIDYAGPLGRQWDFLYNMRLIPEITSAGVETGNVIFLNGLGRRDVYVRTGSQTFQSPRWFYTRLTDNLDGTMKLRERDGMKYLFRRISGQVMYRLESITDRNGNQMTFSYDANNLLASVQDTLGRTYLFRHVGGLLNEVEDFMGRVVRYGYDSVDFRFDLVSVTSPVVLNTPNGNDFPQGKATRYTYSSGNANPRLNHNLLTIIRPNEVAREPDGPAVFVNTYGLNSGDAFGFDRVIRQEYGGVNETAANLGLNPAGGRVTLVYGQVSQAPDIFSLRITDRVGNVTVYRVDDIGAILRREEFTGRTDPLNPTFPPTGKLRSTDPDSFVTTFERNADSEPTRITSPEGNVVNITYDVTNPNRFAQGNALEIRGIADVTRGGNGAGSAINDIVSKFIYEPIFNQLRFVSGPRGLDPAFVPPVNPTDSGIAGIDFDRSGTVTAGEVRRARYTSVNSFDYQERSAADIQALANTEGVILQAGEAASLGLNADVNSDGILNQAQGNLIRVQASPVQLASGGTQPITSLFGYNSRGQMLFRIDPDGSRNEFKYYPEANPHGAGGISADADTVLELGGYLGRTVSDTTATDNADGVALNITTDYRYDPVGNLNSVLDGRGILTRFEVNSLNQVVRATRAADVSASSESGLTAFAYRTTYFYDANENLVRTDVEDRDGDTDSNTLLTATYSYDILDHILESTSEVSPTKSLTARQRYDANENPVRVIEPMGNFHDNVYDERDLLFKTIGGADDALISSTATYNYDKNQNVKSVLDSEDNNGDGGPEETFFFYDGFDRLLKTLDPVGNETISVYDPASNVISGTARGVIGGPSPVTNNTAGNTDLSRGSVQYDELSRVIRTDGEWFISTGVSPVRVPLLVGDGFRTGLVEYDSMSRVIRAVNDNGHAAVFEYDGLSRLIRSIDALQNEATVVYDANSNVTRLTSIERRGDDLLATPETFVTVNRYDALNRPRFTSDNIKQTRRMAYDSRNNVTQISDAEGPVDLNDPEIGLTNRSGNTQRFFYDGINRRVKVIEDLRVGGAGNGLPSLDGPANPNLDPAGLDTTNSANPDGKIIETNIWDDNSRLLSVSDDKGNTTRYAYDSLNRKILDTFADTTTNQYFYDHDSNLIRLIDENGSQFTYTFDGINRMTRLSITRATGIGGTTEQIFEYDGLSRLTQATDNNDPGTASDDLAVTALYDSLSRKIEEIQQGGFVISADFDGLGNQIQLTYPNDRKVGAEYDSLERPKRLNDLRIGEPNNDIAAYSYIGAGRVLERGLLNGTKLTYLDSLGSDVGYDGIKRVIRHRHQTSGGAAIADFTYGYNRENNRLFERRLHQPDGVEFKGEGYTYDSLYRLIDFKVGPQLVDGVIVTPDTKTSYNLDGVGNRTFMDKDSVVTNYTPNVMNEYNFVGPDSHLHDENGNLKDDSAFIYTHDAFNRLIEVKRKSDNLTVSKFTYDAFNRRVTKTVTNSGSLNGKTRYLLDGIHEIQERDEISGFLSAEYVYGGGVDEMLTMERGGQTYYYHSDSLGSVEALTNNVGGVAERTTYDAYGKPEFTDAAFNPSGNAFSSVENPFLFTGRRLDPETGLYYYRNRYYQPKTGRFIERDPMGYAAGSLSLYEYVGSNSVNFTDPMGWSPQGSGAGTQSPLGQAVISAARATWIVASTTWGVVTSEDFQTGGPLRRGAKELLDYTRDIPVIGTSVFLVRGLLEPVIAANEALYMAYWSATRGRWVHPGELPLVSLSYESSEAKLAAGVPKGEVVLMTGFGMVPGFGAASMLREGGKEGDPLKMVLGIGGIALEFMPLKSGSKGGAITSFFNEALQGAKGAGNWLKAGARTASVEASAFGRGVRGFIDMVRGWEKGGTMVWGSGNQLRGYALGAYEFRLQWPSIVKIWPRGEALIDRFLFDTARRTRATKDITGGIRLNVKPDRYGYYPKGVGTFYHSELYWEWKTPIKPK